MKRKANGQSKLIESGGVEEYIAKCPAGVRARLEDIRSAMRPAARDSTETVSFFQMLGYSNNGSDYNGMSDWFSF